MPEYNPIHHTELEVIINKRLSFRTLRERVTGLCTKKVAIPGWLAIVIAGFTYIPDWKSRFDFWINATVGISPYFDYVSPVITSAYFGPALIAFGLAYLILIGQPINRVVSHPAWAVFGWIVSLLILVLTIGMAAFGAFEIAINNLANQKIADFLQTKLDITQKPGPAVATGLQSPPFAPGQMPRFTEMGFEYFSRIAHDTSPISANKALQPYVGLSLHYSGKTLLINETGPVIYVGLQGQNLQLVLCSYSSEFEPKLALTRIGDPISGVGVISGIISQQLFLTNCQPG